MTTFKFPVSPDHIRTFKDPTLPKTRIIHALVHVENLPADIPLEPDPRVPKVKGPVTKRITNSLNTNDGRFHLLNRGITISAKEVEFDSRHGMLRLAIPEADAYGIIDGGHTYKAITSSVESHKANSNGNEDGEVELFQQYVHLEILEGIEGHLADIAEARNFSIQLKAWSLANYKHEFEWFLDALGEDYKRYIKVSENDDEPVGILDLIQVMSAVNPVLFPQSSPPLEAYKNVGKCLDYFTDKDDKGKVRDKHQFRKMAPVARDIIRLHDFVRYNWKKAYNVEDETGRKGRLGKRAETQTRKRNRTAVATYYFLDPKKGPVVGDLPIEKGLSIPLISSFRALLEEENGMFRWATDPFKFFERHGASLVRIVMDASEGKGGNPHHVGRDAQVYNFLYMAANNSYVMEKLAKLQK